MQISNISLDRNSDAVVPAVATLRSNTPKSSPFQKSSRETMADEGFFDLLSRFQSNRMDDQRCCFQEKNRLSAASVATSSTPPKTMIKRNFFKVKSVFVSSQSMQDSLQQWIHS